MASTNTNSDADRDEEDVYSLRESLTQWRERAALLASADKADRTLMVQELTAGDDEVMARCRESEADLEKDVDGFMEMVSAFRDDPENAVELLRVMMGSAAATDAMIQLRGREEEEVAHYIHLSNHREEVVQMFRYDLGLSSDPPPPPAYLGARLERQIAQCDEQLSKIHGHKDAQLRGKIIESRGQAVRLLRGHKSSVPETPNDGDASSASSSQSTASSSDEEPLLAMMIQLLELVWGEEEEFSVSEGWLFMKSAIARVMTLSIKECYCDTLKKGEIDFESYSSFFFDLFTIKNGEIDESNSPFFDFFTHKKEEIDFESNSPFLDFFTHPQNAPLMKQLYVDNPDFLGLMAMINFMLDRTSHGTEPEPWQRATFTTPNFAKLPQQRGDKITTNVVQVGGHPFKLSIFPRGLMGNTDTDYVSIYLVYAGENSATNPVNVRFQIRTKTSKGPHYNHAFATGPKHLWGARSFKKREDMIRDDLDENGTLMIEVDITIGTQQQTLSAKLTMTTTAVSKMSFLAILQRFFVLLRFWEATPPCLEMFDDLVWLDKTMGMVQNSIMLQQVLDLMQNPLTPIRLRELSDMMWIADKYLDPPLPSRVLGSDNNGALAIHQKFIAGTTFLDFDSDSDSDDDDDDDNNNNDCVTTEQGTRRSTSREFLSPNSITSVLPTLLSMKQRPSSSSTVDVTINDTSPDGDKNNGEQRQPPQTTSGNASVFPSSPSSPSSTSSFYSALGSPLPSPDEDVDEDNRNVVTGTAVQNLEDPPVETATTGPEECARCLQYGETVQQALWCRKKSFLCFKFGEHGDTLLRCPLCLQNGTVREAHCCEGRFRLSLCVKFYQHPLEDPQDAAPRVEARTSPDRTMMDANATIATISAASAIVVRASDATGQSTSRELIYPDSNASLSPSQLSTKQCSSSSSAVVVTCNTPNNQRSDTNISNTSKNDDAGNVHSRKTDKNIDGAGNVDDSTPLGHKKTEDRKCRGSFCDNVGKLPQPTKTTTMLADTRDSGGYLPKSPQSGPLLPQTLSLTPYDPGNNSNYAPSLVTTHGQESGPHSSRPSSISSARDVEQQYVSSPTALLGSESIGTKVGREKSQQGENVDIAEVQIVGLNQMTTKEKTIQEILRKLEPSPRKHYLACLPFYSPVARELSKKVATLYIGNHKVIETSNAANREVTTTPTAAVISLARDYPSSRSSDHTRNLDILLASPSRSRNLTTQRRSSASSSYYEEEIILDDDTASYYEECTTEASLFEEQTAHSEDALENVLEDGPSIEREPVAAIPMNHENHNNTSEPHAEEGQDSLLRDTINASKDGYFADHEDMLCDEDNLVDKKSGGKDDAPQVNDVSSTPKNDRHHQNSSKQDVQDQNKDATRHTDPVTMPSSITEAKLTANNDLSDMTDCYSSPEKSDSDSDSTIKCLKLPQVNENKTLDIHSSKFTNNSSTVESDSGSTPAQLNRNPFNDDEYTIELGRSSTNATAPSLSMFHKNKPVIHQFSDAEFFPTHDRLNISSNTVAKNQVVEHQFSDAESFSTDERLKTSSTTIGSENVSVATVQSGSVDVSNATPHSGIIGIESMSRNLRDGISNVHTNSNFPPEAKAPPGTENSLEKKKPPGTKNLSGVSQKQTQCSHPPEVSHNVRAWRNPDGNNGYMSMDSQTTESSVSYQNVGPTGLSEMTRINPSSFPSDPLQNRRNNTAQTSYRAREQQQEHQQHRSSF